MFERNIKGFDYEYRGQTFKYYPDFIKEGIYYETKGYLTDKDKCKFRDFPHQLEIYTEKRLKVILDYARNNYGNDFIRLYGRVEPSRCGSRS